ncbi:MAG: DUF1569 domain-containing protein [Pirellula sp.]|nr:DUF1569 domain-containing protein [Pirellula sp.]
MPRRPLRFSNLDEIMQEVDQLNRSGYLTHGKWDLGQICSHLADWMGFAMDGFPKPPFPIAILLRVLRATQGKRMLHKILETGGMGHGSPTMPVTVYEKQASPDEAVERLRQTIERLKASNGPFHPSPLFGAMSKEELVGLHLVHCAHHLKYLEPTSIQGSGSGSC